MMKNLIQEFVQENSLEIKAPRANGIFSKKNRPNVVQLGPRASKKP